MVDVTGQDGDTRQIRVVLADDHAGTREHIREILEQAGDFDVLGEVADGQEAVQLTERLQPNVLLLLDLHMPHVSGLQAARLLHQRSVATHIVVLTGYALEPYATTLFDRRPTAGTPLGKN